jgi:hypothetical protein
MNFQRILVLLVVIPSYTLVADSVSCDYDPIKKKADIGSNFLERETF